MTVEFAKAKAGHDKNHIYCITRKQEESVYLVNGNTRKLENPKQKNKKHIQIIKNVPIDIAQMCLNEKQEYSDEGIKAAINCYQQRIEY